MITKRMFLNKVGAAGGFGAAYTIMQGMGLLPSAIGHSAAFTVQADIGAGKSVIILGAGLAGLTAAYELRKSGYSCTILEARDRAGGRNWTIRNGDQVAESDGTVQTCNFDRGLYFNAGPARIPSQHSAILEYCKAFDIPMEVFVNANRNSWYQDARVFDGQPIEARQLHNDTAGHISELLAKAIDKDALDLEFDADDIDRLLDFLARFGDLDWDLTYKGSSRSGYAEMPGAASKMGKIREPIDLQSILSSGFWDWHMGYEKTFEQQATMLQPVGGMDRIARAFQERLVDETRFRSIVERIGRTNNGVAVEFRNERDGSRHEIKADYCICTLPLSILSQIESDFSRPVQIAISAGVEYSQPAFKLAWEAQRRFWEDDHGIYGGVSWTQREITQIWYPSSEFHARKGILVGAYNFGLEAISLGEQSPAERAETAKLSGALMHQQFEKDVSKPISVAWHKIPFSQGAYAIWNRSGRKHIYPVLNQPDDRIYFAGEHLSYWAAWLEGAVLSAHHVVQTLNARVREEQP